MVHLKFMAHPPKKIGRLLKKKQKHHFLGFHLQLGETVCYLLCFLHFFAPLGSSGLRSWSNAFALLALGQLRLDLTARYIRPGQIEGYQTYRPPWTLGVSGGVVNAKGGILFFFQKKNGSQLEWLVQIFGREIPDLHRCFFWILASWTSFLWLLDVHVSWFSSQKMVV